MISCPPRRQYASGSMGLRVSPLPGGSPSRDALRRFALARCVHAPMTSTRPPLAGGSPTAPPTHAVQGGRAGVVRMLSLRRCVDGGCSQPRCSGAKPLSLQCLVPSHGPRDRILTSNSSDHAGRTGTGGASRRHGLHRAESRVTAAADLGTHLCANKRAGWPLVGVLMLARFAGVAGGGPPIFLPCGSLRSPGGGSAPSSRLRRSTPLVVVAPSLRYGTPTARFARVRRARRVGSERAALRAATTSIEPRAQ